MKHARSGIVTENIQEILDAGGGKAGALVGFQQQYITPDYLADQCAARLPNPSPRTVLDPQIGEGALVKLGSSWGTDRYGIDIDNRLDMDASLITGNCVKVFEILDELYPDLRFECINCNPPFGKKWKVGERVVDSTELTWKWATKHGNFGYFIANHNTLVDLGIAPNVIPGPGCTKLEAVAPFAAPCHPWVYRYEVHDGNKLWKGMRDTLKIGIAFWKNPAEPETSSRSEISEAWDNVQKIVDEERIARPDFNIYLDRRGYLRTYLSTRSSVKLKLDWAQINRLSQINECHPLTLTTEKETRDLMQELVDCGIYTVQPEAKAAITDAIKQVAALACPIMPVTEFESVAYADEEESLECIKTGKLGETHFTKGKKYPITTGTYKFTEKFKRSKVHFDESTRTTYSKEHECTLSGQDRYIQIAGDNDEFVRFMDRPEYKDWQFEEAQLWKWFKRPVVKTIAEAFPEIVARNEAILKSCAFIASFDYYPGQLKYLARVAAKECGLVAGETGTGKTLMALSLLAIKSPARALIIAPQGTMRSSESEADGEEETEYTASQWIQEIQKFTPYLQVWELFSYEDYTRIKALNDGKLPPGVYVTYYEAMFSNGARESVPETWTDEHLARWFKDRGYGPLPPVPEDLDEHDAKRYWCDQIGKEVNGVRSILEPCLSTLIGHEFDMVLLDEAHYCTNLSANRTEMLIRLQPRWRWAFTATPIPNVITNLFPLMGWLAVKDWYKGELRNAAWPYARGEIGRFNSTFLSEERDLTAEKEKEEAARKAGDFWRGKCVKNSPVISSPARLLKILKPSLAHISKPACNPAYVPPEVIDVRVPMGKEQAVLYGHFLDRGNVPGGHPLIRARRQTAWLRNICADPAGFTHGGPRVASNLNPKVIATLELVRDIVGRGEQVLIISSRIGLTNTLQHRITEAGIPIARIDSTISAEQHAYQANVFKDGKATCMLMGLKCAASHSFDKCANEIITSIEWSPGTYNQAAGRIDRVTSVTKKRIYCILAKDTIEEVMYDVLMTKGDAATICLRGQRVQRDFHPIDAGEILATALDRFDLSGATSEGDCEAKWPNLRDALSKPNPWRLLKP